MAFTPTGALHWLLGKAPELPESPIVAEHTSKFVLPSEVPMPDIEDNRPVVHVEYDEKRGRAKQFDS